MNEIRCQVCDKNLQPLPYICNYCGGNFCVEHRLPEKHCCPNIEKVREASKTVRAEELLDEITAFEKAQKENSRNPFKRIFRKLGFKE